MTYNFFKVSTFSALTFSSLLLFAGCPDPVEDNNSTPSQDMGGTTMTDMSGGGGGGGSDMGMDQGGGTTGDMGMDQGGGTTTPMTPAEYDAQIQSTLINAVCRAVVGCPQGFGEDIIDFNQLTTVEQCVSSGFTDGEFEPETVGARERYNTEKAALCLSELQALEAKSACELLDFFSFNKEAQSACDSVIEGTVAAGSPCLNSSECAGEDMFCGPAADDMVCYGACQEIPAPCEGACTADQYCDFFSDSCQMRVGKGEDCDEDAACIDGLECDYDTFSCDTPKSSSDAPPIMRIADGQPCSYDYDEFTSWCEQGKTCINVDVTTYEGVCGVALAEGAACATTDECQLGLRCFGSDSIEETKGVCGSYKDIGEACTLSEECDGGYCMGGSCTPYKKAGEACSQDAEECEYYCNDQSVCEDFGNGGEIDCMLP